MSILRGKKILLGVSAGIAAYKTAALVRLFIKSGAEVKVIMTPASKDFITPLTLSTLSKNPVSSTFYDQEDENELWNNHVDLGLWADYMLVAPATANTMSKMANGTCDNLLSASSAINNSYYSVLTKAIKPIIVIKIPSIDIPSGNNAFKKMISPSKAKKTSPDCVASIITNLFEVFAKLLAYKNKDVAITPDNKEIIATLKNCP